MKKIVTLIGISLLLAILDNVFTPYILINGYYPSLLFVFLICYSINFGIWEGLWIGILVGVLQDVFFINAFGVNSLINMLCGVLAGYIGSNIFKEKIVIPIISTFLLSIFKGIMILSILYILKIYVNIDRILFNSLYNMVIALFTYKLVYKFGQKEYMQKKWKF